MNIFKRFLFRLWYWRKIQKPHPWDESMHKLFPLGTEMYFEGRKYRYCKGKDE